MTRTRRDSAGQQPRPKPEPRRGKANGNGRAKSGHDEILHDDPYRVENMPVDQITPSPENDQIYGAIEHDEQMDNLIDSIRRRGLEEPLLLSGDGFILSQSPESRLTSLDLLTTSTRQSQLAPGSRGSSSAPAASGHGKSNHLSPTTSLTRSKPRSRPTWTCGSTITLWSKSNATVGNWPQSDSR